MAIYDGFFDAQKTEVDEGGVTKTKYDREYDHSSFTAYFEKVIGSGVCVHNNPDSFKVRLEGGQAVVSPGYLFIQGCWCKNDADYPITLPGTGNYAIAAHLNLGKRIIELEARSVAQAYPDSLVLAIVSPSAAEDTRHNTDICGVIDTAGELSGKVEWAVNYIDNEIENKLAAAEADINAQAAKLDAKIAEVQAQVDRIAPPAVGTIKFSASQDVGSDWLKCDGSFVNEADYPELVAALGKLTPSGDKFKLLSDGEIGPQISNGVVYAGRMWVYSYSTRKLYGVDLAGTQPIKEIPITSDDTHFNDFIPPSNTNPIALSIVPHISGSGAKLFLAQVLAGGSVVNYPEMTEFFLIFQAEFTGAESSLSVSFAFKTISNSVNMYFSPTHCVPTVISRSVSGIETYFVSFGLSRRSESYNFTDFGYVSWSDGGGAESVATGLGSPSKFGAQKWNFNDKSKKEVIYAQSFEATSGGILQSFTSLYSFPSGTFAVSINQVGSTEISTRGQRGPVSIAGSNKVLIAFDLDVFPWVSLTEQEVKSVNPGLHLPSSARVFVDGGAYLWGKDIYMIFVGTGLIFSRTLEEGSFGYLDTTSVLGTITQFGYLDYSQDEGTLYLLGQDTANRVKVAKIVLNTLYDYANDGAWLPMIASDGVPAYIKAKSEGSGGGDSGKVAMKITVLDPEGTWFNIYADVLFNDEPLISGTFTRNVDPNGKFTAGIRIKQVWQSESFAVKMNGAEIVRLGGGSTAAKSVEFNVADFVQNGITLQGVSNR